MSDDPSFYPPRPRVLNLAKARDIARGHKGMAELYEAVGDRLRANREMQESLWWLAYAVALANTTETGDPAE